MHQLAAASPGAKVEDIRKVFNQLMGWHLLEKPFAELVAKQLTEKELMAVNAFYKTPEGASFAKKTPVLSSEIATLIMENIQKVAQSSQ